MSFGCNSDTDSTLAKNTLQTSYTHIESCQETIENDNAAFSIRNCGKANGQHVQITVQSPAIYTVTLISENTKVMSEFEQLSGDLPLKPGPTLEWYSDNHQLRFLVFRISWGTDAAPFDMVERLVINYIAKDRICPLACVGVKTNKNANERVRELISETFVKTSQCPKSVLHF